MRFGFACPSAETWSSSSRMALVYLFALLVARPLHLDARPDAGAGAADGAVLLPAVHLPHPATSSRPPACPFRSTRSAASSRRRTWSRSCAASSCATRARASSCPTSLALLAISVAARVGERSPLPKGGRMMKIRIAHSPDSDDTFMFYALAPRRDRHRAALTFVDEQHDTETLNGLADRGRDRRARRLDRALRHDRRSLAPSSARRVRRSRLRPRRRREPRVRRSSRSRARASACRVCERPRTWCCASSSPDFEPMVDPDRAVRAVWRVLRSGDVDAALVIHEGRLTFEREGFAFVCDIGAEWGSSRGSRCRSACNVIRAIARRRAHRARISRDCRRSIAWALDHRDEAHERAACEESREGVHLERRGPRSLPRDVRQRRHARDAIDVTKAIGELFRRAHERGILPALVQPELAP